MHWKRFGILLCTAVALLLAMAASRASNNDRLLSGWEHLNVFTAFKWMEMTCLHIVWQVAECQDLEGLVYCHDRHQTVLFLFLWQRGREICACDRGWLDIHVALIILPLLLGSHSGVGQALMWVWSHVTLGCWAEVAYWCRHHIVTHISYHGRLFELKAAACVFVLQCCSLNGNRVKAVWEMLLGKQLVSRKFRGNERDVLECKYVCKYKLHAWKVRVVGSLKGRHEKRNAGKTDSSFTLK